MAQVHQLQSTALRERGRQGGEAVVVQAQLSEAGEGGEGGRQSGELVVGQGQLGQLTKVQEGRDARDGVVREDDGL